MASASEEFVKREDPNGRDYYWLTGVFKNTETEDEETDEFALNNGYVSVVPCKIDLTAHQFINTLKTWEYELGTKKK